jgi:hypothetical protein
VVYTRQLELPDELVNGFKLSAGMGIELVLNEFVTQKDWLDPDPNQKIDVVKIFPDIEFSGVMDFELKGINGELVDSSELLVNTKFSDEFYTNLASEINNAFRIGLFTASMVLVRKLFENLIIDVLREKYGERPPFKELYFSMNDGRFHSFQTLINNFEMHIDEFKAHNVNFQWDAGKNHFFKFLRDIKEHGDACAHSIEMIHDPNDLNDLKPSIGKYSDLLVRLIQKIKETPK